MGSQSKQWFGPDSIKQVSISWNVPPQFIYVDVSAKPSPKDLPTNKHIISKNPPEINKLARDTEVLWCLVLMTQFEFGSRASLWTTFAPSEYVPEAHFG